MSRVEQCNDEEELLDRKVGTAVQAEAIAMEKDICAIKNSASISADFVDFSVPRMCECCKGSALTRPVKAYDEDAWPNCVGMYPNMHCFNCALSESEIEKS